MSILFQISNQPFPTPPSFCRVLTAGRNAILHFWLAWLTLSFFSFNLCPSSSYLIRSKCVKSLIICFKNKIHTRILLTYCICNRFSMFALCHSIQTGISITFTVFVAMLRKKFWKWTFLRLMQAYPALVWYGYYAAFRLVCSINSSARHSWILHAKEDVSLSFICHKYDITMLSDTSFFLVKLYTRYCYSLMIYFL